MKASGRARRSSQVTAASSCPSSCPTFPCVPGRGPRLGVDHGPVSSGAVRPKAVLGAAVEPFEAAASCGPPWTGRTSGRPWRDRARAGASPPRRRRVKRPCDPRLLPFSNDRRSRRLVSLVRVVVSTPAKAGESLLEFEVGRGDLLDRLRLLAHRSLSIGNWGQVPIPKPSQMLADRKCIRRGGSGS